ncbi:MAG: ATP synthase F0 subunit C [Oscillospiraceae bacterium]|jgi:F-type H+-transporting ATPase subunit c|nr:ATP synthase F0 subunit C [Oscillospiraceae bacterium]
MEFIAVALCLLPCVAAAVSMGLATGKSVDAVARQPEASGKINAVMLLGMALTEATAIYGFVTALIMLLIKIK